MACLSICLELYVWTSFNLVQLPAHYGIPEEDHARLLNKIGLHSRPISFFTMYGLKYQRCVILVVMMALSALPLFPFLSQPASKLSNKRPSPTSQKKERGNGLLHLRNVCLETLQAWIMLGSLTHAEACVKSILLHRLSNC
jgi:hypothetical protein